MRTKQTARGPKMKLKYQLMDAGNNLFNVSSSTPDILNVLLEMENVLLKVHKPSEPMIKALNSIIQALIDKGLLRHPDMNINISVVCCICEIIRLMPPDAPPYDHQHMKEFFEVVVMSFEKQSFASGVYCSKMIRVLTIFSKSRLPVMMLDLQLEELICRLFKQFLTFADSNKKSSTVYKMEKLMTTMIEESGEALSLEALINTTIEKIASPICRRLGQRVLKNCAAKLRPHRPDMAQDEAKETNPCTSDTSKLMNDTTHKIKLEPLKESINMETNPCTNDTSKLNITHMIKPEHLKESINIETNPCTSDTSKLNNDTTHKINLEHLKESINIETNPCTSDTSKLNNDTTHKIKLEPLKESINIEQALIGCQDSTREGISDLKLNPVSFNDPSATSNCVTEVNGKRKRNDEKQRVPKKKVLYSLIRVHGYKIKKSNAPILEAIFKKHGDITSNCVVKTASVRESILEVICEVVNRIQTNDVATIISDMEEIEMQVLDAESTNMNVAWLRTHLEALHKKNVAQKQSTLLGQMKANTSLVKRAAKMDLEERRIELVTAQEQFKKAERCIQVLDLVETKLHYNFLESEAEKDLWLNDSVL